MSFIMSPSGVYNPVSEHEATSDKIQREKHSIFFFKPFLIRNSQGSSKSAPDLFKQNLGHNPITNCYLKEKDFCLWGCHCFITTKTARGQDSCLSKMISVNQTPIFSLYCSSPMTLDKRKGFLTRNQWNCESPLGAQDHPKISMQMLHIFAYMPPPFCLAAERVCNFSSDCQKSSIPKQIKSN